MLDVVDTAVKSEKVPFLKVKDLQKEYEGLQKLKGADKASAYDRLARRILFSLQHGKADVPKEAARIAHEIVSSDVFASAR